MLQLIALYGMIILGSGTADMKPWKKERPKGLGKPKPLSSGQKASAKAAAQKAGRPYPNLIDNMRVAAKRKGKS